MVIASFTASACIGFAWKFQHVKQLQTSLCLHIYQKGMNGIGKLHFAMITVQQRKAIETVGRIYKYLPNKVLFYCLAVLLFPPLVTK